MAPIRRSPPLPHARRSAARVLDEHALTAHPVGSSAPDSSRREMGAFVMATSAPRSCRSGTAAARRPACAEPGRRWPVAGPCRRPGPGRPARRRRRRLGIADPAPPVPQPNECLLRHFLGHGPIACQAVPSPRELRIARVKQRRDRLIAVGNLPARRGLLIHHALRIADSPKRLPPLTARSRSSYRTDPDFTITAGSARWPAAGHQRSRLRRAR